MLNYLVTVLFFFSGFSALIYELAWMRMLILSIGVTAEATSCVLAVFLGGLALGSYLGGRLADKLGAKSLTAYGLVEISVGISAPLVSWAISAAPHIFVLLLGGLPDGSLALTAGRFTICAALLLPPTILMGASLPFLTRYLFEQKMKPTEFFSFLYGVNTAGGALGTLAGSYVGFTYFGLQRTILMAAAINIIVGIAACLLAKSPASSEKLSQDTDAATPLSQSSQDEARSASANKHNADTPVSKDTFNGAITHTETAEADESKLRLPANAYVMLCVLAGLSGATSIAYETLWSRMLRFSTTSTTYAFTAIVSMFLIGLALGSLIYNYLAKYRFAKLTLSQRLLNLAHVQYLSAIACSASLLCLPASFLLRTSVPQLVGHVLPGYLIDTAFLLITTIAYMFVPSTLIGISFPMIAAVCTAAAKQVSSTVGTIYAANTIGCVLGAAVVGIIAIPTIGSFNSFQIVIVMSTITGALAIWVSGMLSTKRHLLLMVIPFALALSFSICVRDPMPSFLSSLGLLKYGEDIAGSVMVLQWPDHKQLIMNGEGYSSTIMRGRRYMRLMGHLPVLLSADPEDCLVICFGMGTTAGSVALYPQVKNEDIVELSPLVLESGALFKETNYSVLSNPKVHPHIGDGRNYLLRCKKKYGVITLEPPPPTEAGIVNLYSKEFYELLKQHLKPGGVACQWLPMSCESGFLWRGMLRSATDVFPYVSLWESNNGEAILIGSNEPVAVDFLKLEKDMAQPGVHESLIDVGLASPYSLLATFVNDGSALRGSVSDATALTDDLPQVEFFLPYNDRNAYNFDLEAGSTDVSKLMKNKTGFDTVNMTANRRAMTLLRQATRAQFESKSGEAATLLQEAVKCVPDNAFFQYAKSHNSQSLN